MVKDRVKFSTKRHKKRKGFCGRKVVESENKLINVNTSENSDSTVVNSESLNVNNESTNLSNTCTASGKKNRKYSINIQLTSSPANKEQITGYRLVDIEILSFIFSELGCLECCKCELNLREKFLKKKGLDSCLLLTCILKSFILQFQMIIPLTSMSELLMHESLWIRLCRFKK